MIALNAYYDGKVLVPDTPLALPANQKVRIQLEPIELTGVVPTSKRILGLQRDALVSIAPDFDAELDDEFWTGAANK